MDCPSFLLCCAPMAHCIVVGFRHESKAQSRKDQISSISQIGNAASSKSKKQAGGGGGGVVVGEKAQDPRAKATRSKTKPPAAAKPAATAALSKAPAKAAGGGGAGKSSSSLAKGKGKGKAAGGGAVVVAAGPKAKKSKASKKKKASAKGGGDDDDDDDAASKSTEVPEVADEEEKDEVQEGSAKFFDGLSTDEAISFWLEHQEFKPPFKVLNAFEQHPAIAEALFHENSGNLAECNGELAENLRHPDAQIRRAAEDRMIEVIKDMGPSIEEEEAICHNFKNHGWNTSLSFRACALCGRTGFNDQLECEIFKIGPEWEMGLMRLKADEMKAYKHSRVEGRLNLSLLRAVAEKNKQTFEWAYQYLYEGEKKRQIFPRPSQCP